MTQDLQKKAEAIKQELLALQKKGYGNIDTSLIKGELSALPALPNAPQPITPTLPQTSEGGGLVGFKDTMAQVMNLATQKRDDLLKQFMMPLKGTAAASDFGSVLSNFSSGSDTMNKQILQSLIPKPDNQIITETDASGRITATIIDKNTGDVINTADLGLIGKPSVDKLKKDDYATADNLIKIGKGVKATYEQHKNAILQNTSLNATEADIYLTSQGIKKEIDPLDKIKTSIKDAQTLGYSRNETEQQIEKDMGSITEPIKKLLDETYGKKAESFWSKFW